jgi:hypothetical protein
MANLVITQETVKSGMAALKKFLKIEKDGQVIGYMQPTYLDFNYGIMSHNYIAKSMVTYELKIFQTLLDVCNFLGIDSDEFCEALPKDWEKEKTMIF